MSRNKSVGILNALARLMVAPEWFESSDPSLSLTPSRTRAALLAKKESYIASMGLQRWQV